MNYFFNLFSLKQQDWIFKLELNKAELNTWRNRSKNLLYSMLPYPIAVKIEEGIQPNTICQVIFLFN